MTPPADVDPVRAAARRHLLRARGPGRLRGRRAPRLLARLLRQPLRTSRPRAGRRHHRALRELRSADGRARHPVGVGARRTGGGPGRPVGGLGRRARATARWAGRRRGGRDPADGGRPAPRRPAVPSAPPTLPCRGPTNRWPSCGRPPPCSGSSAATATSWPSSPSASTAWPPWCSAPATTSTGTPSSRTAVGPTTSGPPPPRRSPAEACSARTGGSPQPASTSSTAPRRSPTSWPRNPGPSPAPTVAERFLELAAPLAAAARTALPAVNPIGLPGAIGKSGSARPARG